MDEVDGNMLFLLLDPCVWQKNHPQQNGQIPFSGAPGFKLRMPDNATILDFYKLFMQCVIMDIVIETNRYGSQKKPESWEPITVNDRERLCVSDADWHHTETNTKVVLEY